MAKGQGPARKTCQHPYMTTMRIFTVPNIGKGHCLFASLADQVYGDHSKHEQMRKDIVAYIRQHPEDFFDWIDVQEEISIGNGKRSTRKKGSEEAENKEEQPFVEDHFTALNNRLERMANREWGDEIEIAAFCQAFDYDVVLFTPSGLRVLNNPKHDAKQERRRIHIAYGGEHRFPHYESIRKFDHCHDDADSQATDQATDSTSRESSQATEPSGEKSIEEINAMVIDLLEKPTNGATAYTPRDVKIIDVFDLSQAVLKRKDIKGLIEDAASKANITLNELIKRDRERSRSSRSSSYDTASSGKRSRQPDEDEEEENPSKKNARRRSQRIKQKKKISLKLLVGPDPNAPPSQSPTTETNLRVNGTVPDHRSPLSQSQSTDDVRPDEPTDPMLSSQSTSGLELQPQMDRPQYQKPPTQKAQSQPPPPKPSHEAESPITIDARA